MLERVLRVSIRHRWLVVLAATAMAALGIASFVRLPIDAVPDITNVQVQINTVVEGMSPQEVEKQVTFPVETAMAGLPGLEQTRSISRYGLSQVTVIFRDGTDIYFARQLVNERLQDVRAELPQGFGTPTMGPISTGLGEIFMWTVNADRTARKTDGTPYSATDLREIEDWVIAPQLRTVPGVTEINTIGGYRKQYHVTPDPTRLVAYGFSFADVEAALEKNNSTTGGGYIEQKSEQYLVRTTGRLTSDVDIRSVVITTRSGTPIRISDVAAVGEGKELRTGAATLNGAETVVGTALMLIGANSRTVSSAVAARLSEVNRTLPSGVHARTVYDRTKLVDRTLETVRRNLLEGAGLVIVVLLLFLGNLTGALVVALVIPLSMLFAITGMVTGHISANLLSLGAIDFGIIVDGAVVMTENILHRLGERQHALGRRLDLHERVHEVYTSATEVARPTLFGVAIIMIVYLPLLALTGIEGKMFRPMAQVALLVLLGALILTFTFVPPLMALALRGSVAARESIVMRVVRRRYVPSLEWALRRRRGIVLGAGVLVIGCALLATRLGSEFVPRLDEGDMTIESNRIPGTGLEQTLRMEHQVDSTLVRFPQVATVFSKIGTAEIATDPAPPGGADVFIILKSRDQWPHPHEPKADLVEAMEQELAELPGNILEFTQPIEMRFNEMIAGVRSDVAVKVFGEDLPTLTATANRISAVLGSVRGASGVRVEQVSGLPTLTIDVDRATAARYGLTVEDVQAVVRTALAGTEAGEVFEGDRRFEIIVRLPEPVRRDLRTLGSLPLPVPPSARAGEDQESTGAPRFIPLSSVARLAVSEGPNQISRENGKRRVVVQANVRGRDIGSFVADAQSHIAREVSVPAGYWLTWGGQYENLQAARRRLAIVVPLALLSIFLLLFASFGSAKDALLVFSGVPLALTGGILALAVRGMPVSITAAVGFIALSGVAVLNGLVMVSFIRRLRADGALIGAALRDGCAARLRQVVMIALVAALGFVPMALASGTGAEVQRPLATVVIGGILSSTLLTLLVLPALYRLVHRDPEPIDEP